MTVNEEPSYFWICRVDDIEYNTTSIENNIDDGNNNEWPLAIVIEKCQTKLHYRKISVENVSVMDFQNARQCFGDRKYLEDLNFLQREDKRAEGYDKNQSVKPSRQSILADCDTFPNRFQAGKIPPVKYYREWPSASVS